MDARVVVTLAWRAASTIVGGKQSRAERLVQVGDAGLAVKATAPAIWRLSSQLVDAGDSPKQKLNFKTGMIGGQ
jgi:hypothetical protein